MGPSARMLALALALLGLLRHAGQADAHGAVTQPKPRQALEGTMAPWSSPLQWPIAFAETPKQHPYCPLGVAADEHQNFSGALGQACYWFSGGCSIGCAECDGVTRGPIPRSHPAGGTSCAMMGPTFERNCQRKMDTCQKGYKATNCKNTTRTLNINAECGGPTDWYYYSPVSAAAASFPRAAQHTVHARTSRLTRRPLLRPQWRAPGSAPVFDACGLAGGGHRAGGFGGVYFNTSRAVQGDYGSKLPPLLSGTVWAAGQAAEVAWAPYANHGALSRLPVMICIARRQSDLWFSLCDRGWIPISAGEEGRPPD
eukprot:SAG22_NODE_39_length_26283_cov_18.486653_7_plen_313_part_00